MADLHAKLSISETQKRAVILVIEGNIHTPKILTKQLSAQNYEVVCHSDGTSGLAWLVKTQPDLAILDAMLPDMSGLEICHRIHQYIRRGSCHIMLSALEGETSDRVKGLKAGANDLMAKPSTLKN